MALSVWEAIHPLCGTDEGGTHVGMGADGTPTKLIDKIAEDIIIVHLKEHKIGKTLVSEEIGKIALCGEEGTIYLDPVDGTYNAEKNIPFYALSVAYAVNGQILKAFVKNLATGEEFSAEKGRGAFLNGCPIMISDVSDPAYECNEHLRKTL